MSLRFVHLKSDGIAPYVEGLRALERDIEYPIADGADAFRIDHGAEYHPFFSDLGDANFILGLDGDRVVATIVGVSRDVLVRGRVVRAAYGADMKVAASHRGRNIPRGMVAFGLRKMLFAPGGTSWRYGYVAAMRGAKGDVIRTVRGAHPGKLVRPAARMAVYFARPEQLAALEPHGAPVAPRLDEGIDLSPSAPASRVVPPGFVSTAGRKDLRLRSTGGAPWPLVHLPHGPARATPDWGTYLRDCGAAMCSGALPGPACFAVDVRLQDHLGWLGASGLEPGATCTVYALSLTPRSRGARWVHLATSEI